MEHFSKTTDDLNKGKLKDAQVSELKKLFQTALVDGRISTKELTHIQFFYYDSELSESDFSALKESVFEDVVRAVTANNRVSEHDYKAIFRIAKQLNISPGWQEWAKEHLEEFFLPDENFSENR